MESKDRKQILAIYRKVSQQTKENRLFFVDLLKLAEQYQKACFSMDGFEVIAFRLITDWSDAW